MTDERRQVDKMSSSRLCVPGDDCEANVLEPKKAQENEDNALKNARNEFKKTVAEELEKLLHKGEKKSVAVLTLLKRIAGQFVQPKKEVIDKVANGYKFREEDAIHALIVTQELRRLTDQGVDRLAAIRELTRRVKEGYENENSVKEKALPDTPSTDTALDQKEEVSLNSPKSYQSNGPFVKTSRKRCLGDDALSSSVLKRLRKFAMKDTVPRHEEGLEQNSDADTCENQKQGQQPLDSTCSKTTSTPQQTTLGKKRSISNTAASPGGDKPSKKTRKSKH